MKRTFFFAAAFMAISTSTAMAHPGHTAFTDLGAGLVHPFIGLDHILAMVAVGLLAVQSGGKARFVLPALFVGTMLVGGLLGLSSLAIPYVETGIIGSVILLGSVIASGKVMNLTSSSMMVVLFSLFHGIAHGVEMQPDMSVVAYGAGMAAATAVLHMIGMGIGQFAPSAMRIAGAAVAVSGVALAAV